MEVLEEKIKKFLKVNTGFGSGSGSGFGSGSGSGYGSGSGSGYGYGSGSGSGYYYGDGFGDGYGDGSGDGLKSINNKNIYCIDNVQTIILSIHNNIARGYIVNRDLTLEKCYIAKGQNEFAHGDTIRNAVKELERKLLENLDEEEAIEKFVEKFKSNKKYDAYDFYNWHHILTGSCEMGRKSFAKNNSIDLENDKFTVEEFIKITENSYNGDVIKRLKEHYSLEDLK